jgi:pimeloyl-ACP methyl ester carboxylesterase
MTRMAHAPVNGIEVWYETHGDPTHETVLLIMGLGAQAVVWDEEFVDGLVERDFHVIRFDNRDVGLSTKLDGVDATAQLLARFGGQDVEAPYLIGDMAADAAALLDHLEVEQAHIVGASMGGMIAQQFAIDHPHKVRSLTSIMSTTGDPDVGTPTPEAMAILMTPPPTEREEIIARGVETSRLLSGPHHFDEGRARRRAERTYDRMHYPEGIIRQLVAILSSPSRTEGLRGVTAPAVVIHGTIDPLVTISGGHRTAEALPDAELIEIAEMAHDVAPEAWPTVYDALVRLRERASSAASA